ncbi:MAG: hypothetical protein ACYDEN_11030, partial [Acidimicrobiales bacterium]
QAAGALGPGAEAEGADLAAADGLGPMVAHVSDPATGEVSLYLGEREVVFRDPALVARLARVAR